MKEQNNESTNSVMEELDSLIGLESVKNYLMDIVDGMERDISEQQAAITAGRTPEPFYRNLIFNGPPGTGKTTVANLLARLMTAKGLLSNPNPVVLHACDFSSGGYVDAVRDALSKKFATCDGCVVVMDDFYEFNRAYSGGNIANEAFGAIKAAIDRFHNDICFVLCGYEEQMEEMFTQFNPGMLRRFPFEINFPAYAAEDIMQLYRNKIDEFGAEIEEEAVTAAMKIIEAEKASKGDRFGNMGFVTGELWPKTKIYLQKANSKTVTVDILKQAFPAYADSIVQNQEDIDSILAELESLVGLDSVKKQLRSLINGYVSADELKVPESFVFIGNPGTGKTAVAILMGKIFKALGVLKTDKVIYAKKADLVAGYIGQSSIKTGNFCKKALDGVLELDEAYQLTSQAGTQAGFFEEEAYNEIMTFLENHRDRICMIFSGYEEERMRSFLDAGPGMAGRKLTTIHFPDYSAEELLAIYKLMASKEGFMMDEEHENAALAYFEDAIKNKNESFYNARIAQCLFRKSKLLLVERLVEQETFTDEEKYLLTGKDFLKK